MFSENKERFSYREWHCVHLHEHLEGEEGEEDEVGVLLELVQPLGLVMMLRRLIRKKWQKKTTKEYLDDCVEEDKGDDEPEHELGLADVTDSSAVFPVPPGKPLHWKARKMFYSRK